MGGSIVNDFGINASTLPKQNAWSYSSVEQHDKCPAVIRFRKIDRLPEPKSEHLVRGLSAHEQVAWYLTHGTLPDGKAPLFDYGWQPFFNGLRLRPGTLSMEHQIAFDKEWNEVPWFDKRAWLRVVIDAVHSHGSPLHVDVFEWKTGKQYPTHEKQGRLYALAGLLKTQPGTVINVRVRYLDRFNEGLDFGPFTHDQLEGLKNEFTDFAKDFLNDDIYPAKPNRYCNFCHFRKSNSGPCTFG